MINNIVLGVGINDLGYSVKKQEIGRRGNDGKRTYKLLWTCPYYSKWKNMLERCFSKYYSEQNPTYKDCTVEPDWLYASKFKAWMETQDWEGKELDKDLLIKGNKHYEPETYVFLSKQLNAFLVDRINYRGKYPLGVTKTTKGSGYKAECRDPFKIRSHHIGIFDYPQNAHLAWKARKHQYACELAELEKDERIINALKTRYL